MMAHGRVYFLVSLLAMFALLAGCATKPRSLIPQNELERIWHQRMDVLMNIERWQLDGRIAISSSHDSWSASLMWAESPENQEVRVIAPLGQGSAILRRLPNEATELSLSTGEVFVTEDISELLHRQLGWYLPLESLAFWIKGVPDPNFESDWDVGPEGSLAALEQGGWSVEYKSYRFSENYGVDLPARLVLKKDDWRIKVSIQDWQVPQQE